MMTLDASWVASRTSAVASPKEERRRGRMLEKKDESEEGRLGGEKEERRRRQKDWRSCSRKDVGLEDSSEGCREGPERRRH